MPEPQSLEEAWEVLFAMLGRPAREHAARNLALAVLQEAQGLASIAEWTALRARIAKLGADGG